MTTSEEERAAAAARLDELLAQEERLQLPTLSEDDAWRLGVQLVGAARAAALPVVVSVRRGRQRLFHAGLPGSSADNDAWADRKARVVERFGRSSWYVGSLAASQGRDAVEQSRLDRGRYAPHGGAFPLRVRGTGVVGVVVVSGLPQAEDHAFVVDQLERYLGALSRSG